MVIVRLRNKEEHKDLLKKVKKMKKFTEELEDCLEDAMYEDDDEEYRYRDDEDYEESHGRYVNHRKGGGSRGRM